MSSGSAFAVPRPRTDARPSRRVHRALMLGLLLTPAAAAAAPYLDVELLLDNSASMEIGATPADIATMLQLTPCAPSNASFGGRHHMGGGSMSGQSYAVYTCASGDQVYDGPGTCPIPALPPYHFTTFVPGRMAPSCEGYLPRNPVTGMYPSAGAPCAFACHWNLTRPAGTGDDFYGLARATIGRPNQITLRFDQVKRAVHRLITDMREDDLPSHNLKLGIFTFDAALTRVYPPQGEAGDDWQAALAAVGLPPTAPGTPDTGIQPYGGGNGGGTDFPRAMTALSGGVLTQAGDGAGPAQPRKVLVLITDGLQDGPSRDMRGLDPTYCRQFKNLGYVIYVVHMPYYPLMNPFYLQNVKSVVEGTGPDSTTASLKACASDPTRDYAEVTEQGALDAALTRFFRQAVSGGE